MIHIFDSSDKKRIKSHLKIIIHIANADGRIDEDEQKLVEKISKKFGITEEEIHHLLKNDAAYEYHPPVELEERFEFLYDLMMMMMSDQIIDENELKIFRYTAINLNFNINKIDDIISFFTQELIQENDPEKMFKDFKKIILT